MYLLIIQLLQLKELHESRNFCLFCLLILSVTEKFLNKCLSNKWISHFQVLFPPTNFIGFGGINPLMSLPRSKICIGFPWLQKEVTLLNGLTSYNHSIYILSTLIFLQPTDLLCFALCMLQTFSHLNLYLSYFLCLACPFLASLKVQVLLIFQCLDPMPSPPWSLP